MKKSIVWLASYPKSGNTWTRIFLSNYLLNADKPVPINEAHRLAMGDSIAKTYRMVAGRPIDVRDVGLTLNLRDKVLRAIVRNGADVNLVKTHNLRGTVRGVEMIPEKYTRSAVYVVRNPLDMVLSYARHYAMPVEQAVETISHRDNGNAPTEETVAEFLGSWSDHVESWTSPSPYPVLVLRYEDLLDDPAPQFAKLVEHMGMTLDEDRLDRAIRFSSFKEVSKQEKAGGFVEKSAGSERFFAKGTRDQWKTDLGEDLARRLRRNHRDVMKRYGYLK
ncbi:MAG: sulfotransferase domain-containing protein [Roseovarius sp.]|nr:sulfotransferase domain-containing protein [Roseovarius sp.]